MEIYVPVCFDQRTRKLIIDQHHIFVVPIRRCPASGDGEVISTDDSAHSQYDAIAWDTGDHTQCAGDLGQVSRH